MTRTSEFQANYRNTRKHAITMGTLGHLWKIRGETYNKQNKLRTDAKKINSFSMRTDLLFRRNYSYGWLENLNFNEINLTTFKPWSWSRSDKIPGILLDSRLFHNPKLIDKMWLYTNIFFSCELAIYGMNYEETCIKDRENSFSLNILRIKIF